MRFWHTFLKKILKKYTLAVFQLFLKDVFWIWRRTFYFSVISFHVARFVLVLNLCKSICRNCLLELISWLFFKVNIIFYCKLILSAFKWGIVFLSCVHNIGGRTKNCNFGKIVPCVTGKDWASKGSGMGLVKWWCTNVREVHVE